MHDKLINSTKDYKIIKRIIMRRCTDTNKMVDNINHVIRKIKNVLIPEYNRTNSMKSISFERVVLFSK